MFFHGYKAMSDNMITLLFSILFIVIHSLCVTCIIRYFKQVSPIIAQVISAILILMMFIMCSLIFNFLNLWIAACALAFGVSGYLFVFGFVSKSLSLRILLIAKSNGGEISFYNLDQLVIRKSFSDRGDILLRLGYCNKIGNQYCISPEGIKIVNKLNWIRKNFGIFSFGLYKEEYKI
jgi:hypothetical protein